jgi:hypothetical protein
MTKDAVARVCEDLEAEASALRALDDSGEAAKRLASLLERLERHLIDLLGDTDQEQASDQERLYLRAASDFAALQSQLAHVRTALSDRPGLLRVLRESGHEVDSTRQHLVLVGAMDQALQHLVHLMQYDTPDRAEIDVRQGFQLSSGSTNYGRFYFEPPKENSGN